MQSIEQQLRNASQAKRAMAKLSARDKQNVLTHLSEQLLAEKERIKHENQRDLDNMDPADPRYDRLIRH